MRTRWLLVTLAMALNGLAGCDDGTELIYGKPDDVGWTTRDAYLPPNHLLWRGWCYADGPEWMREGAFKGAIRHEHEHVDGDKHEDDAKCLHFVSANNDSAPTAKLCKFERP
jgi:hypothetical protein